MNMVQTITVIVLSSMVIGAFLFSSYIQLDDYLQRSDKTIADIIRPIGWPITGAICFFGPFTFMLFTV